MEKLLDINNEGAYRVCEGIGNVNFCDSVRMCLGFEDSEEMNLHWPRSETDSAGWEPAELSASYTEFCAQTLKLKLRQEGKY